MTDPSPIALVDLAAQRARLEPGLSQAVARVLDHGQFIHGPEVAALETELTSRAGGDSVAVTCASGTDALLLAVLALGLQPGQKVAVPTFTFAATAEVIALIGAVPVFVDVDPQTWNISAAHLAETAKEHELAGVIAVDLYGLPADYAAIHAVADACGAWVIGDAAQSFGATVDGVAVGALTAVTTTSFFPAKPLGCYGDGGALFVPADLAPAVKSLRVHGQGSHKYDTVRVGINGRLDTLQAAILLEKLRVFDDELSSRRRLAANYDAALKGIIEIPTVPDGVESAWAQYSVVTDRREELAAALTAAAIGHAVYYPRPLSAQPAYAGCPVGPGGTPVADTLAQEILSIPVHPYLGDDQERVIDVVLSVYR